VAGLSQTALVKFEELYRDALNCYVGENLRNASRLLDLVLCEKSAHGNSRPSPLEVAQATSPRRGSADAAESGAQTAGAQG